MSPCYFFNLISSYIVCILRSIICLVYIGLQWKDSTSVILQSYSTSPFSCCFCFKTSVYKPYSLINCMSSLPLTFDGLCLLLRKKSRSCTFNRRYSLLWAETLLVWSERYKSENVNRFTNMVSQLVRVSRLMIVLIAGHFPHASILVKPCTLRLGSIIIPFFNPCTGRPRRRWCKGLQRR